MTRRSIMAMTSKRRAARILLSAGLLLMLLLGAEAQSYSELSGHVWNRDKSPAKGVVVTIGSFGVATDDSGFYKLRYLKPGVKIVSISPPGKVTRTFRVVVDARPTQKDFVIDW